MLLSAARLVGGDGERNTLALGPLVLPWRRREVGASASPLDIEAPLKNTSIKSIGRTRRIMEGCAREGRGEGGDSMGGGAG